MPGKYLTTYSYWEFSNELNIFVHYQSSAYDPYAVNVNGPVPVDCYAGYFCPGLAPQACPPGTYSTSIGAVDATTCIPCPTMMVAASAGSTACAPCAYGSFSVTVGSSACGGCAAGTYLDYSVSASTCLACAPFSSSGASLLQQAYATSCAYCPKSVQYYSTDPTQVTACTALTAYGNMTTSWYSYTTVHLFTSSAPYVTFTQDVLADVMLVGGGGNGGSPYGGGGGGGSVVVSHHFQFKANTVYSMIVGGPTQATTISSNGVTLFAAMGGGNGGNGLYSGNNASVQGGMGGGGGGCCYACTNKASGGQGQPGNIVAGAAAVDGCFVQAPVNMPWNFSGYYSGSAVGSPGTNSSVTSVPTSMNAGAGGNGYAYANCASSLQWSPCPHFMTVFNEPYPATIRDIATSICGTSYRDSTPWYELVLSQGGVGGSYQANGIASAGQDALYKNSGGGGAGGNGGLGGSGASGAIVLSYASLMFTFPCAAGLFVYTFNADNPVRTCSVCQPGSFSLGGTVNSCTPCPIGTYNNIVQAASCSPCANNTFTPTVGSTRCCTSPGFYIDSSGAALACPAGSVC
jgi:Tyrosine-protein kinase ephrin type A/B receptor-like